MTSFDLLLRLLSDREIEVFLGRLNGVPYAVMAERAGVCLGTIYSQHSSMNRKLGSNKKYWYHKFRSCRTLDDMANI